MLTRLKLWFVNLIIVAGCVTIVAIIWPDAVANHSYSTAYQPAVGSRIFLAVLMCGIPALLFAVCAHVALSHLLFRPGEIRAYRARKTLAQFPSSADKDTAAVAPARSTYND